MNLNGAGDVVALLSFGQSGKDLSSVPFQLTTKKFWLVNLKSISTPKALNYPRNFYQRWMIMRHEWNVFTAAAKKFTKSQCAEMEELPSLTD
jgi:hypothetical protein